MNERTQLKILWDFEDPIDIRNKYLET
jgi:hypothetical protein